jgi:hypothetical protein
VRSFAVPDTSIERAGPEGPGLSITRSRGFSNSRDWHSFLAAAQPTAYASVATALKAGHAWLTGQRWAQGLLAARGSESCSGWAEVD